jgi:hypothetical protein
VVFHHAGRTSERRRVELCRMIANSIFAPGAGERAALLNDPFALFTEAEIARLSLTVGNAVLAKSPKEICDTSSALRHFVLCLVGSGEGLDDLASCMPPRDDVEFYQRLGKTLLQGNKAPLDNVDTLIVTNWEVAFHWRWAFHIMGRPISDDLSTPLKHWSDNAALEFVRFWSGMDHNLSEACYVQRRKRMGLHPHRPTRVKAFSIR